MELTALVVEVIKHLAGHHNQKLHASKKHSTRPSVYNKITIADISKLPETVQSTLLEVMDEEPFPVRSKFKKLEIVDLVYDFGRSHKAGTQAVVAAYNGMPINPNQANIFSYTVVILNNDKEGQPLAVRSTGILEPTKSTTEYGKRIDFKDLPDDITEEETQAGIALSEISGNSVEDEIGYVKRNWRRNYSRPYSHVIDWVNQGGDKEFARAVINDRPSLFSSPYSPSANAYREINPSDYVQYYSQGADSFLEDLPVTPNVTRNLLYEDRLGMPAASRIYLGQTSFSDIYGRLLPEKLSIQYMQEVDPRSSSLSPSAWYLRGKGVDEDHFPDNRVLDWPITEWLGGKALNPSMTRERVIHVEGAEPVNYTYMDKVDELRVEDLVTGVNTSPDRAFARTIAATQQRMLQHVAWLLDPNNAALIAERKEDELPLDYKFPKAIPGNANVTQLMTPQELNDEGIEMSHCVGNYGNVCAAGTSVIYSIVSDEDPKERGTLEIGRQGDGWTVVQFRAYHDRKPSRRLYAIARSWADDNDIDHRRLK